MWGKLICKLFCMSSVPGKMNMVTCSIHWSQLSCTCCRYLHKCWGGNAPLLIFLDNSSLLNKFSLIATMVIFHCYQRGITHIKRFWISLMRYEKPMTNCPEAYNFNCLDLRPINLHNICKERPKSFQASTTAWWIDFITFKMGPNSAFIN